VITLKDFVMNTYTVTFHIQDEEIQQIEATGSNSDEALLKALDTIKDELADIYDVIPDILVDSVEMTK